MSGTRGLVLDCLACGGPTTFGKPYCIDHIQLMPYVADLLQELLDPRPSRPPRVFLYGGLLARCSAGRRGA